MTTPIVNLTPVNDPGFFCLWGDNGNDFIDGVCTFSDDVITDAIQHHSEPLHVYVASGDSTMETAGIFNHMPDTIVARDVFATLNEYDSDTETSTFIRNVDVIGSIDGRVVFKPDFARAIDLRSLDTEKTYKLDVFLTVDIAYQNPSADTPVYDSQQLQIYIIFPGTSAAIPAYSPIDAMPYIRYTRGTETESAI